jgi:hypothetical protein
MLYEFAIAAATYGPFDKGNRVATLPPPRRDMPEQFAHETHIASRHTQLGTAAEYPIPGQGYNQFDYLPMGLKDIAEASMPIARRI